MKQTLRTTWPAVRPHLVSGITYYLVDTRRAGLSIPRKTFKTQDEALTYAADIAEKFSSEGKQGIQKIDFILTDQVKKWTDQLSPYGKDIQWAINYALNHLKSEAKITKTIAEYLQDWQDSKIKNSLQPLRPDSIRTLKARVSFFQKEFNGNLLSLLTKDYIQEWMNNKDVTNSTRMNYKRYLTNFFNWLIDNKLISENPMKRIKIANTKGDTEFYTFDQVNEMVDKVPKELVGWFALCLFAGVRPTECGKLTWNEINLEHGEIFIPKTVSKVKRERIIYCFKNGLENLIQWLKIHKASGLPLIPLNFNPQTFQALDEFKRSLTFSWIQDGLRHTFSTWYFAKHQSYEILRAIMGTSDVYIDKNYKRSISQQGVDQFWTILPKQ